MGKIVSINKKDPVTDSHVELDYFVFSADKHIPQMQLYLHASSQRVIPK